MEEDEMDDFWPDPLWISESPAGVWWNKGAHWYAAVVIHAVGSKTVARVSSCVAAAVPQEMVWSIYTATPESWVYWVSVIIDVIVYQHDLIGFQFTSYGRQENVEYHSVQFDSIHLYL